MVLRERIALTNKKYTKADLCFQEEKVTNKNAKRLAEKYVADLNKVRIIQNHIIPQDPITINEHQISSFYRPAYYASGDFYDYVMIDHDKVGIFVADVTGKGIKASVITVFLKYTFQNVIQKVQSPKAVISELNMAICSYLNLDYKGVCGFYCVLDTKRSTLTYSYSGLGITKLFSQGKTTDLGRHGGSFMGAFENVIYTEDVIKLQKGDIIVIGSDGLEDAMVAYGEVLGHEWIDQVVSDHRNDTASPLINRIEETLNIKTGHRPFLEDDIACVCLEIGCHDVINHNDQ